LKRTKSTEQVQGKIGKGQGKKKKKKKGKKGLAVGLIVKGRGQCRTEG